MRIAMCLFISAMNMHVSNSISGSYVHVFLEISPDIHPHTATNALNALIQEAQNCLYLPVFRSKYIHIFTLKRSAYVHASSCIISKIYVYTINGSEPECWRDRPLFGLDSISLEIGFFLYYIVFNIIILNLILLYIIIQYFMILNYIFVI
jgi:hypothetical protein